MRKKYPGNYGPIAGKDPEKIHQALDVINPRNAGRGATLEEIVVESGVSLKKVQKEMRWGKKGNTGETVIEKIEVNGRSRYRHALAASSSLNKTPPAVRILPMNLSEFPGCNSAADVKKKFFLDELPLREDGSFYVKTRGLNSRPKTVVLFQCENRIIATAVFKNSERFDQPDKHGYLGALHFEVKSIRVFDPMNAHAMKKIWPKFNSFSHVKQSLDPVRYSEFERILKGVILPQFRRSAEESEATESTGDGIPESGGIDQRILVKQQIKQRQGRTRFRNALRKRHGDRCVITKCRILELLDAAHIKTLPGKDDNSPANGLLLRTDLHTLFDLDLLGIHPDTLRVEIHPDVAADPAYAHFAGIELNCTADNRPLRGSLQDRYELFTQCLLGSP